jgi:hypothetical protein
MASMFTSFGIAKGFAAASIFAVVGSAPAAAQLGWDQSTAPIKYLEYNLPYYKLPLVPLTAYTYSRPEHRLAFGRIRVCTTTRHTVSQTRHQWSGLALRSSGTI